MTDRERGLLYLSEYQSTHIYRAFPINVFKGQAAIESERRERLLGRARELITEAGFKIGMSDGGNVTEAKPDIKWDKVERSC